MLDLLIENANLATPLGNEARRGAAAGEIFTEIVNIGVKDGKIAYIGADLPESGDVLDAGGWLVTPGLVDCHTHLVFGGFRHNELPLKLAGADYMEILASGGGILSTVAATRAAEPRKLYRKATYFLNEMLEHGTTTVEAKSGYGLDFETELKQLQVVAELRKNNDIDIVSTFMGAHAVPPEFKGNSDDYVDKLVNEIIPKIAETGLAEFCDIFCEEGVFDVEQSRKILAAAKEHGFKLKIHADEIVDLGGAALAAEMGAISAEHLIAASDSGLEALAKTDTIAVLLPTTSFYLGKPFARARKMLDLGIPIAIASDFNPGSSPNFNLQLSMTLAYLQYRMHPAEILTATTLNAACALNLGETKGSIEVGKDADIIIWDCPDLNFLLYRFGNNKVDTVIKRGVIM
ncbi:MAG: imidazolonepropionase [Clostridiales bacterium]|jgi:imidazolonepropionase|nr:imidazolonepropionase [Clostridiales bacterium]